MKLAIVLLAFVGATTANAAEPEKRLGIYLSTSTGLEQKYKVSLSEGLLESMKETGRYPSSLRCRATDDELSIYFGAFMWGEKVSMSYSSDGGEDTAQGLDVRNFSMGGHVLFPSWSAVHWDTRVNIRAENSIAATKSKTLFVTVEYLDAPYELPGVLVAPIKSSDSRVEVAGDSQENTRLKLTCEVNR